MIVMMHYHASLAVETFSAIHSLQKTYFKEKIKIAPLISFRMERIFSKIPDFAENIVMILYPKLYIPSTPNNSNRTHTFMCLGRAGRFGQC